MKRALTLAATALALAGLATAEPRPAQPFEATTYDGQKVSLDDLKGSPSVVIFFSTDCPHCQQTSMRIAPFYTDLTQQGLKIVGLSLNKTDKQGLRSFAERFEAAYPLALSSREEFSRIAGVSVMTRIYYPYILFLNKEGEILEEHQGSEQRWFAELERNFLAAVEKLFD